METLAGRARVQAEFSDVSEMIIWARNMAGFTQLALAKASGISENTILRAEKGRLQPSAEKLFKILNTCGFCISLEPMETEGE